MTFPTLQDHRYALLTTFRKSGEGVGTPIWFALVNGKLYIITEGDSGKAKRIRNNPRVTLAPCNQSGSQTFGPPVEGRAQILPTEQGEAAKIALDQKYGFFKYIFDFVISILGRRRGMVYLEIVPAEDSESNEMAP